MPFHFALGPSAILAGNPSGHWPKSSRSTGYTFSQTALVGRCARTHDTRKPACENSLGVNKIASTERLSNIDFHEIIQIPSNR